MIQATTWRAILTQDAVLAAIIAGRPEIVSSAHTDIYLSLVSSIISQQLSTKVAAVIKSRFLKLFTDQYPYPDELLALSDEMLRGVGLSFQKIKYIRNVTAFKATGQLEYNYINTLEDEALISHLIQIKGVGRWTAEMILMFALDRPDVFPALDLGIQNAIKRAYNLEASGTTLIIQMRAISDHWRPFRTIACKYLWQSLDNG